MKSILISIRPEWTAKILNGEKTIEIRKTAPKCDLPIDVYIYCTKSSEHRLERWDSDGRYFCFGAKSKTYRVLGLSKNPSDWRFNGKVVAKFRLKKIERIISCIVSEWGDDPWEKRPALRLEETDDDGWDCHFIYDSGSDGHYGELYEYLGFPFHGYGRPKNFEEGKTFGYAWHISDLEIFDEPKELDEFSYLVRKFHVDGFVVPLYLKVAKAPQSWKYMEVEK